MRWPILAVWCISRCTSQVSCCRCLAQARQYYKNAKGKNHKNVACKNSIIYKNATLLNCKTCPYIANNTQRYTTFQNTSYKGKICNEYTSSTSNLIYLIQCKRCTKSKQTTTDCEQIGQTGRTPRKRFGEHRRDIPNNQHEKSGVEEHFNRLTTHLLTSLSSHSKPYVIDEKAFDEHGNNNLHQSQHYHTKRYKQDYRPIIHHHHHHHHNCHPIYTISHTLSHSYFYSQSYHHYFSFLIN